MKVKKIVREFILGFTFKGDFLQEKISHLQLIAKFAGVWITRQCRTKDLKMDGFVEPAVSPLASYS